MPETAVGPSDLQAMIAALNSGQAAELKLADADAPTLLREALGSMEDRRAPKEEAGGP
ncbi:MAG: hypothetical protein JSR45_03130 [Proteobacteria bacterium]|nr:hypothetical protein [Pseudomonadota bacterium]